MSYTVGNWSVESQVTDSITTPKALSVPDLSYADDYSVASHSPTEIRLASTTGPGILPQEWIRYGRVSENNVYTSFDVAPSQQVNVRQGVVLKAEVKYLLKATNQVSGAEVLLPMRGWINLKVPVVDLVTSAALEDLLKRTIACALKTGLTDGALVQDLARGDLDPTV